jgi:uncharacterized protein (DUF2147 family)
MHSYGASLKLDHVIYVGKGGLNTKGLAHADLSATDFRGVLSRLRANDGRAGRRRHGRRMDARRRNARVRIAPCGDKTCATNLWIRDTSKGEAPGDRLVMSLKRSSDTEFSGTAYDPKRGITYSVDVTIENQTMKTKGCVLARLLCKTVGWT